MEIRFYKAAKHFLCIGRQFLYKGGYPIRFWFNLTQQIVVWRTAEYIAQIQQPFRREQTLPALHTGYVVG